VGTISKDTFKRLFLLYLINEFKDGAYGKLRLLKIAYFIEREFDSKLYEYKWHHYGEYSEDLSDILEQLISMGFVSSFPFEKGKGNKYKVREEIKDYSAIIDVIPGLKEKTKEMIITWGYAPQQKIIDFAYSFDEVKGLACGDVIFRESLPDRIELKGLDGESCEELDLAFNPRFIAAMEKISKGIETSDFDISKVKAVASIL